MRKFFCTAAQPDLISTYVGQFQKKKKNATLPSSHSTANLVSGGGGAEHEPLGEAPPGERAAASLALRDDASLQQ